MKNEPSKEFQQKYAGIANRIIKLIPSHFRDGCITVDTLQQAIRDEYPGEPGRNLDKLVENVGFMLQENSNASGKCILEEAETINIVL